MSAAPIRQAPLTCRGHTRPVVDLAYSPATPDGFFLISACKDGKPMLRDGKTGDWIGTFEGHSGAVWGVAIDANAEIAATGSADFTAKVWSAVSGECLHTIKHRHIVKSVDISDDGRFLLTGCNDKRVRLFDLTRPDAALQEWAAGTSFIKRALFVNDGQQALTGGDDGVLRLVDLATGNAVAAVDTKGKIADIFVQRDRAIVCSGRTIQVFSTTDLSPLADPISAPCNVLSAAMHEKDDILVWGGDDNVLRMAAKDGTLKDEYKNHFGPIHCVRFSPDGQVFASCSEDGTVRLWQSYPGTDYGLWRSSEDGQSDTNAAAAP